MKETAETIFHNTGKTENTNTNLIVLKTALLKTNVIINS